MSGIIFALATPDSPRKTPATARQFRPRQSSRKGNVMWKKYLSWLITTLLLVIPVAPTANAQPQKEKAVPSIEQTKLQVAKLGLGEKARATVTMKTARKQRDMFTAPVKMISSFAIGRRTRRRQFDMRTWPRSNRIEAIRPPNISDSE